MLQSESKPNNEARENELLSIARKSVLNWQKDVEMLIEAISQEDTYKLGILRTLLGSLKDAEHRR